MSTTIEFDRVSKHFGSTVAVEDLTATVRPGVVTAFLGPNGAGKTTTLRMLLGLVTPTSGTATFDGRRYEELPHPVRQVGALLEATGFHPGRTALNHLRTMAVAARLDRAPPRRRPPQPPGGRGPPPPASIAPPPGGSWRRSGSPTSPTARSAASLWACGNG